MPEDLEKALNNNDQTGASTPSPALKDSIKAIDLIDNALRQLGTTGTMIANVIKGISTGSWIGLILQVLAELIKALSDKSTVLKSLMDGISYFFSVFAEKVGPALDKILKPLLEGFEGLGVLFDTLAVSISYLAPVLSFIIKFFVTIANTIGKVIGGIFNGVIGIIRSAISAINKLPGVNISKPGYVDLSGGDYDIPELPATTESSSSSSSSGASASYTAARDIYINVIYNNSYVNGDSREIALSIRDEIKKAEALGY